MVTQLLEIREVQVERVNGAGFKTTDGDWLNFSKFGKAEDLAMPRVGDRITVHLDRSGFVRKVEAVAPPATSALASATAPSIAFQGSTRSTHQNAPEPRTESLAGQSTSESSIVQDDRGIVITRLAVLNTATAILSSGGGATTEDEVLTLAARLEAWATR